MNNHCLHRLVVRIACCFALFAVVTSHAQSPPTNSPTWLNSWSFASTNWYSDLAYAPLSYTNLHLVTGGDGASLLMDDPDPSFLRYNVVESDGTTNLALDEGSVLLWINPSWSSTNQGGSGPGEWSRLIEVGSYTTNASYGWWSLYLNADGTTLNFAAQTNSGLETNYFSAPVSFTNGGWYNIVLTYSSTNTALWVDGVLITNGPGITILPPPAVLTNGFTIGSDTNGTSQLHGMIDDVATFAFQMDSNIVIGEFEVYSIVYYGFPVVINNLTNAPSGSTNVPTFNAVSGPGILQFVSTNTSGCVTSSNFWITNMTASLSSNQMENVTFSIAGGTNDVPYDVFGTTALGAGTNSQWVWLGQGYHCSTYTVTVQSNSVAFLVLGSPHDSDADGLTDAYEMLVSKTDPNNPSSTGNGILDGWAVLWGLNPQVDATAQSGQRSNFTYDLSGRLKLLTGIRAETIGFDPEGNIFQAQ